MKGLSVLLFASVVLAAHGFAMRNVRGVRLARSGALFSEPEADAPKPVAEPVKTKTPTELAPVNEESISNAAGVSSAVFGFLVGGPLFALVFGTVGVYVSKKDNEVGEGFRGVGKAIVETYNYLTKLDNKYDVTGKTASSITKALDSSDSEVVDGLKSAISKVDEINKEYDITGKATSAAGAATTLSEAAYEKVEELNAKYDFVETTKKAASTAVEKIKEASKN